MQHATDSGKLSDGCKLNVALHVGCVSSTKWPHYDRGSELSLKYLCMHESLGILVKIIIQSMNEVVCVMARMNPRRWEYLSL